MSEKQQRRSDILCRLRDGVIDGERACGLLGVSRRHVRRLLARYVSEGVASVVDGNRGREPAYKTPAEVRSRLAELAGPGGAYHDANTCHMQELPAARDGIRRHRRRTLGKAHRGPVRISTASTSRRRDACRRRRVVSSRVAAIGSRKEGTGCTASR